MNKKLKKITLYVTTIIMAATAGIKIKSCKDKSNSFTNKVIEYTNSFDEDDFLIAAHRGYSSLAVENTKGAFDIANNCDYVDYIEMDARLTNDNKLVLSHNNTLLTKEQQTISICDNDYEELVTTNYQYLANSLGVQIENLFNTNNGEIVIKRSKKLENNDYNIISLKEGIESCNNKKILLDLKFEDNAKDYISALENELKDVDTSNIIFQSDDLLSLLCLKEKHPEFTYLAIIKNKNDLNYISLFDYVGLRKNLVSKDTINELIEEDKKIAIWTLNDPNEINRTINKLGDNYNNVIYISDYPDVVATCLNEQEKRREKTMTQH